MSTCIICEADVAYRQNLELMSPRGESDPERIANRDFCADCLDAYVDALHESEPHIVSRLIGECVQADRDVADEPIGSPS